MNYLITILITLIFKHTFADKIHFADGHGPISVMGDHMHKKNEIMFSYRLGKMKMGDTFNGTDRISRTSVMSTPNGASNGAGTYMNAPISMNMNMHMLGAMYAPSDNLTLMIMGSYLEKEMTSQRMAMAGGAHWDVNSSGIGDIRISGLLNLMHSEKIKTHIGLGLSIPTGSIDERDITPASSSARLGYAMQNGSGTFDPFVFINNVNVFGKLRFGEQLYFKKVASGKNSKGYNYGSTFQSKLWSSLRLFDGFSSSIQLSYEYQGELEGQDDEMNPRMSPAMDSKNQGHQKLNFGLGFNYVNHNDFLKNNRLAFELILPVFKRFTGIQMGEKYRIMLGWQYGF